MKATLAHILARFSEASSYAGLGAIFALVGWNLPPDAYPQIAQVLAAACGLAAIILKDKGVVK